MSVTRHLNAIYALGMLSHQISTSSTGGRDVWPHREEQTSKLPFWEYNVNKQGAVM